MPSNAYYITHPQVKIDPEVAVPKWGLNVVGKQRVADLVQKLKDASSKPPKIVVIASDEVKALETAKPLASSLDCELILDPLMGENDRSATGFLPPDKFEQIADQFFAKPNENILGWESAKDAQVRIVTQYKLHVNSHPLHNVIFVGHGAVGTLLYCHLAGQNIDRKFDQSGGGGNFLKIDMKSHRAMTHWQPLERFTLP